MIDVELIPIQKVDVIMWMHSLDSRCTDSTDRHSFQSGKPASQFWTDRQEPRKFVTKLVSCLLACGMI